jgi:hypothetical protein
MDRQREGGVGTERLRDGELKRLTNGGIWRQKDKEKKT